MSNLSVEQLISLLTLAPEIWSDLAQTFNIN